MSATPPTPALAIRAIRPRDTIREVSATRLTLPIPAGVTFQTIRFYELW